MSNQELSLVPADSASQQFSTKGSLDWVGLGRVQFSASIAVLGRLSAAGVEPLTVAVGQAMCSRIPLGVHGEKVLMEAMSKLKAFSSAGDLIWFGVGVKHILRTLVETSQGASLVALCAALAEGHTIPTAALIIYEMAKVMGSPDELRPSYAQWQALVKVCSSVFVETTFGVRLQQLLNLCGTEYLSSSWLHADSHSTPASTPAYPPEFAQAVLGIGKVSSGTLRDIELTGGAPCAWLAVFAEYILGLRVQVRKDSGQLLSMNHSPDQKSQVVVILGNSDIATTALRCTGQSYVISSGADFIRQFFKLNNHPTDVTSFIGGRVPWQSMLHDVFGNVVDELLTPVTGRQWMSAMKSPVNIEPSRQDAFLTMMVYAAERIVTTSPAIRYRSGFSFLQQTPTKLPELTPIQDLLLKKNYELRQLHDRTEPGECINISAAVYKAAEDGLATFCGCRKHNKESGQIFDYCIVKITEFIISLLFRDVTDKVEQAYRVHVGAGSINTGSQHRDWIFDGQKSWNAPDYPARELVFDDGFTNLFTDSTSSNLRMKPVIGEGVNISFCYELSNGDYYTHVSPATLTSKLYKASRHRVATSSNDYGQTTALFKAHKQLRVIGEGRLRIVDTEDNTFKIMLRPHHGNLLGRIVSLIHTMEYWSERRKVIYLLVDDKEDLARAKRWFNEDKGDLVSEKRWTNDQKSSDSGREVIYCFIS